MQRRSKAMINGAVGAAAAVVVAFPGSAGAHPKKDALDGYKHLVVIRFASFCSRQSIG